MKPPLISDFNHLLKPPPSSLLPRSLSGTTSSMMPTVYCSGKSTAARFSARHNVLAQEPSRKLVHRYRTSQSGRCWVVLRTPLVECNFGQVGFLSGPWCCQEPTILPGLADL